MAHLMPLPLTVSCFSKIQNVFAFLVTAHPGSPGQRAVKRARARARARACVCVCDVCYTGVIVIKLAYSELNSLQNVYFIFLTLKMKVMYVNLCQPRLVIFCWNTCRLSSVVRRAQVLGRRWSSLRCLLLSCSVKTSPCGCVMTTLLTMRER